MGRSAAEAAGSDPQGATPAATSWPGRVSMGSVYPPGGGRQSSPSVSAGGGTRMLGQHVVVVLDRETLSAPVIERRSMAALGSPGLAPGRPRWTRRRRVAALDPTAAGVLEVAITSPARCSPGTVTSIPGRRAPSTTGLTRAIMPSEKVSASHLGSLHPSESTGVELARRTPWPDVDDREAAQAPLAIVSWMPLSTRG